MASFTDIIPQFNPYVAQQPVESMVQVGMMKQQQYDTNLEKIYQSMSNVAGLDVVRDSDKAYLNDKMNSVSDKLRVYAAGDFSRSNLTRSVNGLVNSVADDEIVQTAVQSTMKYREQLAFMKKEQEEGNLAPENVYDFQMQANKWLTGTEAGEAFNGQYQKYFDVNEYVREAFDAIKPEGKTYDEVFTVDENGNPKLNPAMRRLKQEGLMPEKVKAVVDQIFSDGRVKNQLAITGRYNYQGASPEMLKQRINAQTEETVKYLNDERDRLLVDKALGKDVQASLDRVDTALENAKINSQQYIRMAEENPDALRAQIYTEEARNRYNKMFTGSVSETWHVNPQWKGAFEIQKEANVNKRFKDNLDWQKDKFSAELLIKEQELALKQRELTIEADKDKDLNRKDPIPGQQDANFDVNDYHDFRVNDVTNRYNSSSNQLIWKHILQYDNYDELQAIMKRNPGMTQAEVIDKMIITKAKQEYYKNNPLAQDVELSEEQEDAIIAKYKTDKIQTIKEQINSGIITDNADWSKHRKVEKEMQVISSLDNKVDNFFEQAISDLDLSEIDESTLVVMNESGENVQLTREDILDIAVSEAFDRMYLFKDKEKREKQRLGKMATERISRKLSPDMISYLQGKLSHIGNGRTPEYRDIKMAIFNAKNKLKESPKFTDAITQKEDLIKEYYRIDPNLNYSIFDGNTEVDKGILNNIRLLVSTYEGIYNDPQNASSTFGNFKNEVGDTAKPDELNINAHIVMGENGEPVANLVTGNGNIMVIPVNELERFGIDVKRDLGTSEAKKIMEYLSNNPSTSQSNPYAVETYTAGDYLYDNNDFPQLRGVNDISVKVNIVQDLDGYKPVIYVGYKDPETKSMNHKIFDEYSYPNLESVLLNLKGMLTPTYIKTKLMLMNQQ